MNSTKHTPGPWDIAIEYEGNSTYPARFKVDGGKILAFGWDGEEGIYAHNAADVSLISAAPDLFAAAVMLVEGPQSFNIIRAVEMARAAIKKARGEP